MLVNLLSNVGKHASIENQILTDFGELMLHSYDFYALAPHREIYKYRHLMEIIDTIAWKMCIIGKSLKSRAQNIFRGEISHKKYNQEIPLIVLDRF